MRQHMCIWLVCGRDKIFFGFTAIASKIGEEEDEGVGVTVVTKTPFDYILFSNEKKNV